jgi:hypothetical protein
LVVLVLGIKPSLATKDEAVLGAKDGYKVIVILVEEALGGKGVFALAGGSLDIIFFCTGAFVNDAGTGLGPESDLVGRGFSD